MPLTYRAGKCMAIGCFSAFARFETRGLENVPPRGRVLLVANHQSNADPPVLVRAMPRRLHFVGKQELFSNPIAGWLLRSWGVHPIRRDGTDTEALRWMVRTLDQEQIVAVFPEGTRHPRGMGKANRGVAYVALKANATILPVGITGTEHINGYGRIPFPFCRLTVNIGQPFSLPPIDGKVSNAVLDSLTDMIMARVAAQLPKDYQGVYGAKQAERQQSIPS